LTLESFDLLELRRFFCR